jgi:hypothetical protein
MTNPASSVPSFLRDAFKSHATYSNSQKQDAQKRALKWLQFHINTELADKTIMEQFTQKWRFGAASPPSDQSPLYLEIGNVSNLLLIFLKGSLREPFKKINNRSSTAP